MHCPFLNEAEVRFCGISPFRKMLLNTSTHPDDEKCSSPKFVSCPLTAGRPEAESGAHSCPFLRETLVQFCSAAPSTHLIPYSETLLSCCQSNGYRYCDLYLNRAEPDRVEGAPAEGATSEGPHLKDEQAPTPRVDGIDLPQNLSFSANHMWLDLSEDGWCHLGADAFLAKVVGDVEKISFVVPGTVCRPTAVLRVSEVDLTLVFPARVQVSRSNVHLRVEPNRMVSDPYGRGWLFEGRVLADSLAGSPVASLPGLLRGKGALAWMKGETERMTRFVHEVVSQPGPESERLLNDGGVFEPPIVPHLAPEDRMLLFNAFFSLDSPWRLP